MDGASFHVTYYSVDGLELQLPDAIFPFRRILSLHAKLSSSRALDNEWIQPTESFESYFNISDNGIQEPRGIGSLTWREVHTSIHNVGLMGTDEVDEGTGR